MVKVPSCADCNLGASLDDEYFRLTISLRHDVYDDPAAVAARESAMRSLARPEARGLLARVAANMRDVELRTPAGLYVGHATSHDIDADRPCRVAERTALGLRYRDIRRPLPDGYEARTYLPAALDPAAREAYGPLLESIVRTVATGPPQLVGRVLRYWRGAAVENPDVTATVLSFYRRVVFVTFTVPRAPSTKREATAVVR